MGFIIAIKNSKNVKESEDKNIIEKVNTEILSELSLDKYLGIIFKPSIEINRNLLDKKYSKFNYYFYNLDSVEKINIQIKEKQDDTYVFTKYSNYMASYENLLGKKKVNNLSLVGFKITDLIETSPTIFHTDGTNVGECNNNDEDCYVVLFKDIQNTDEIKFSSLEEKDNLIKGNIKLLTVIENKKYELNGKFEFKYFEENNKKYATSLIITYVEDGYKEVVE